MESSPEGLIRVETAVSPLSDATAWPSSSLLGQLSHSEQSALLGSGHIRRYRAGECLVREGDKSTHVFVLIVGMVKVTATTPEGHTTLLAIRVAGDIVGELAPIDNEPRSASVIAATPTQATVIMGRAFLDFLAGYPAVSLKMMRAMSSKLRSATNARVAAGAYPVDVRLAQLLRALARSYGEEHDGVLSLGVSLSQAELAALVGSSQPAIHKALSELRKRGAIQTGYRRIIVQNEVVLNEIAERTGS